MRAKSGPKPKPVDPALVYEHAARGLTKQQIAAALGMSQETYYQRQKANPEIAEEYQRGRTKAIGVIEHKLYEMAASGNLGAMCFYLRAADRKYVDRKEVRVDDHRSKPENFTTDELREQVAAIRDRAAKKGGRESHVH